MQRTLAALPHAFPEFQRSLTRLFGVHGYHKLSKIPRRVRLQDPLGGLAMVGKYDEWSQQRLIARIKELEKELGQVDTSTSTHRAVDGSSAVLASPASAPAAASSSLPEDSQPGAARKEPKPFDASRYSSRLIALKFAYLGQRYNGFEHHRNNYTPMPTVEEELWKALVKTRLITPTPPDPATDYKHIDRKTHAAWDREGVDVNWDGCEYSKCGRTDRGVSAFGQVIGVRVRSNRPLPKSEQDEAQSADSWGDAVEESASASASPSRPVSDNDPPQSEQPFDDYVDEMPYIQLLNRVLPPDIRIYAWCPKLPSNFSARFSCKERRYKYFFTNPSFAPVPGPAGVYNTRHPASGVTREGWLDIEAMKEGCKELVGLHDFRNFCKIDPTKQITNYTRRIFHADIEEVSPLSLPSSVSHLALQPHSSESSSKPAGEEPKLYAFTLHGSAFLWHQVRSIVAILFLIGQKLEAPSPRLLSSRHEV